MRKGNKAGILAGMLVAVCSITGCGSSAAANTEKTSPYYKVTIDGEYENYAQDDERVMAVSETVNSFVSLAINRDYKAGLNMSEYDYYTKDTLKQYETSGTIASTESSLKKNELVQVLESCEIQAIEFYTLKGSEACSVKVKQVAAFAHGTESYLERIGVKLNGKYSRITTIIMINEDNKWCVKEYSSSAREEVK